ncbi:imelysin family protein [Anaerolineales bacterium]
MKKVFLLVCLTLFSLTVIQAEENLDSLKADIVNHYADLVFANYQDAYDAALALDQSLHTFVEEPSEETFQLAKEAWLAAREPYGQTEAFRFYAGPIDDINGPEGLLNAWPLDEAYIDYIEDNPNTGIINNTEDYPEITRDLLESLNEMGAEENISVGYHAIEFLLWGQDRSPDTAGQRPLTDFTSGKNAERRSQYLLIASELLVEHLDYLVQAWNPEIDGNFRETFLTQDLDISLANILTGIGVLSRSELAGERIFTAYDNQDQEDEHSCFSDNTHRDIYLNFKGIQNVYLGTYTRIDGTVMSGPSLSDLLEAVNPELNETVLDLLTNAETAVTAIEAPFDQAIIDPAKRKVVLEAVYNLFDLGDGFSKVGSALGLTINTSLPG